MGLGVGAGTGEEHEVHAREGAGLHGLDDGGFVADSRHLAGGLFVVEEEEVGGGEQRLLELLGELLAQQGVGSDDCDPVHPIWHSMFLQI